MKLHVLGLASLMLASSASADVTVEYQGTMNVGVWGLGSAHLTSRIETKADRSRIVTLTLADDAPAGTAPDTSIDIVREDKHVRWAVDSASRTYCEYPWPDTRPEDPRVKELDAQAGEISAIRPTGEHVRIHGMSAEHYVIERQPKRPNAVEDVWLTTDVPHYDEVKQQCKAYMKRMALTHPSHQGEEGWPAYTEKANGLSARLISRVKMTGSDVVKATKMSLKGFDPATSMFTFSEEEMTMFSQGPIDDSHFEVPPGYTQAVWSGAPQPKTKDANSSHSPR